MQQIISQHEMGNMVLKLYLTTNKEIRITTVWSTRVRHNEIYSLLV